MKNASKEKKTKPISVCTQERLSTGMVLLGQVLSHSQRAHKLDTDSFFYGVITEVKVAHNCHYYFLTGC